MSAATKIADEKILRELVPLNTLSQARFEEILGKIVVEEVRAGSYLFHTDDRDKQTVFLLGGEVELIDGRNVSCGTIKSVSDESCFPLADAQPRILSARALKKCVVARIDSSLLDAFLSWDDANNTEAVVLGVDGDEDWMTRMLQSKAFEKIPPAKIQQLLLKMDAVQLRAGDSVIRQGEAGDCFYTIKNGKCVVTRRDTAQSEDLFLAELVDGDCFGEEALVLDVKRNATVTMLTDGVLMRLAKVDFVELLQKPLVRYVDYKTAERMVDEGAVWVDVRTPDEYDSGAVEDSVNIPLSTVRRDIPDLVFNVAYILCCGDGQCSASAAFILSHRGFDVYVLEDGLRAMPNTVLRHVSDSPMTDPEEGAEAAAYEQQISTLQEENKQLESNLARVQEQHERSATALQGEAKRMGINLNEQAEQISDMLEGKRVAAEVLDRLSAEWAEERSSLCVEHESVQQHVTELEGQLEQTRERNTEVKAGMREEMNELVDRTNSKIEHTETQCVALQQSQSGLLNDIEGLRKERDDFQRDLVEAKDVVAGKQNTIDTLNGQLASVSEGVDEHVDALSSELEAVRRQLGEEQQQSVGRLAQINDMQDEIAVLQEASARLEQKASEIGEQKVELLESLGQRDEQESAMQLEYEQSLEMAHDDLTRKNEIERDLQGQINRLRKKLDQTGAEFEKERNAARVDIDSVREELHAERSARSTERAEMAARQRELKDQLVAVAVEHEGNLSIHSGAIEQARLVTREEEQFRIQQMQGIQVETEAQLDKLQQELTQAHDEIAELVKREKNRRHEEHDLADDRKHQYESSLEQMQGQTGQLVQERDMALKEQRVLRDKVNTLRAEVEVARGLMSNGQGQVEDPLKLRRELDESRRNVEIAVRLRAEAEATCDRLKDERDELQKQVGTNMSLGKAVNVAASDDEQDNRAKFTARAVKKQRIGAVAMKALDAVAAQRSRKVDKEITATWHRAARILGLGVILIVGLEYGLNAFVDYSDITFNQSWEARVPSGLAQPATPERVNAEPVTDEQILETGHVVPDTGLPGNAELVVTPDAPVDQAGSSVSKVARMFDLLASIIGPALWKQDEPVDESLAAPIPEAVVVAEAGKNTAPRQVALEAQGAFRDSLKGGGSAPQMMKLPAARYMMGSQGGSLNFDEGPRHEINLLRFAISTHEVTFAAYDRFARANGVRLPYDKSWGRGNRPAINVSWKDAQAYVQWLSAQTGHTYRLPTESQWEFAARAGELTPLPWDISVDEVHANCFDCGSQWDQTSTAPVGSFTANHFGLYDMGGNVQEWIEDCYRLGYNGASSDGSALLISGCTQRAVRGGAYTSPVKSLRGTNRSQYDQDTRLDNLGFRVVRKY